MALLLLLLGYLVVDLNRRLCSLLPVPGCVEASWVSFYLLWAAICGAACLAWPEFTRIPWLPRLPTSRNDVLLLIGVVLASALMHQTAILRLFSGSVHAPPSALALLSGGVLGPVVEEWLFRGLLHALLLAKAPRLGTTGALVLGALIFGFWHLPFEGHSVEAVRMALVHATFGGLMALLRWRFDGLLPGCIIHALSNSLTILTS